MECSSVIYRIDNKTNQKCYVGSAVNFKKRKRGHLKLLRKNNHHSSKLQNSWNKHGEENFEFIIIEYVPILSDLIKREQYWIDKLNSAKLGYNMAPTAGSQLGIKATEETRKKLSAARIGKKFSQEHKDRISEANKGKKFSQDTINKMSSAKKSRSKEENDRCVEVLRRANTGRRHDPEQVEKLAANLRGKPRPQYVRDKLKAAWVNRRIRGTSEETRRKISLAGMGRKHSEETKKKMSESAKKTKRRKWTQEEKTKFSISRTGKKQSKEQIENSAAARRGLKRSPEIKEKMRKAWVLRRFVVNGLSICV